MAITINLYYPDTTLTSLLSNICEWDFKVESIKDGQCPTIRRLRIFYLRNITQVNYTFNLQINYIDLDGNSQTYNQSPIAIPQNNDGRIGMIYVDFEITALLFQIIISTNVPNFIIDRVVPIGDFQELSTI